MIKKICLTKIRPPILYPKFNGFSSQKQQNDPSSSNLSKTPLDILKQQNKDFENITIQKRPTKLPLKDTSIKKPSDYYDPKKGPFRESQGVFNFNEPVLNNKSYELQVFGLGNGYFSVNDVWYPGSIITFPRQLFLWDVANAAEIRPHSLDLLDVIKPYPIYVIIGTGKEKFDIPTSTYERFAKKGIKVEILPTFEACSTFNVCVEDGKNVCAFLIPANL